MPLDSAEASGHRRSNPAIDTILVTEYVEFLITIAPCLLQTHGIKLKIISASPILIEYRKYRLPGPRIAA